jgi:hypothetical protein
VQELVDVSEMLLDCPHGVDSALRDTQPHADLQQNESGSNFVQKLRNVLCDEVLAVTLKLVKRTPHVPVPSMPAKTGTLSTQFRQPWQGTMNMSRVG